MTDDTRQEVSEALEKSIQHWKTEARRGKPDNVSIWESDCALCDLFLADGCLGCPVYRRTGKGSCEGSPWIRAYAELDAWKAGEDNGAGFRAAAKEEIAFLESLREDVK